MTGSVAPAAAASSAPARRASTLSLQPKDPVQIAFHDLTYDVAVNGQPKRLLHGISGHASPGQVLAIMGSSGAGKTTLLKLLSGRQLAGVMGGRLLANGAPVERKPFRRIAAFVTQDDLMLETQRLENQFWKIEAQGPSAGEEEVEEEYILMTQNNAQVFELGSSSSSSSTSSSPDTSDHPFE